jgi:hypothetical protein
MEESNCFIYVFVCVYVCSLYVYVRGQFVKFVDSPYYSESEL